MATDDNLVLKYNRSLIGFDPLFTAAYIAAPSNYPPFNITNHDNTVYTITLAVAGFKKSEISISLTNHQLVVTGKRNKVTSDFAIYMHQGLALRDFEKTFGLADNIEVQSAIVEDGLLTITLTRIVPETTVTRQIEIK